MFSLSIGAIHQAIGIDFVAGEELRGVGVRRPREIMGNVA
jgi:hypothetical protein